VCGAYYLDKESVGARCQRAIKGLLMISIINVGQWVYALVYQFSTGYDKGNAPEPPVRFGDGAEFWAPFILFMYCGLADSLVQTYAYWIIGAISNDPKQLSMLVGYYKGVQSFGAALSWIIEANGVSSAFDMFSFGGAIYPSHLHCGQVRQGQRKHGCLKCLLWLLSNELVDDVATIVYTCNTLAR
jgi:hypothetical protein